jgi:hypothetical protein
LKALSHKFEKLAEWGPSPSTKTVSDIKGR